MLIVQVNERLSVSRIVGQGRPPQRFSADDIVGLELVRGLLLESAARATKRESHCSIADTDHFAIRCFAGSNAITGKRGKCGNGCAGWRTSRCTLTTQATAKIGNAKDDHTNHYNHEQKQDKAEQKRIPALTWRRLLLLWSRRITPGARGLSIRRGRYSCHTSLLSLLIWSNGRWWWWWLRSRRLVRNGWHICRTHRA